MNSLGISYIYRQTIS